MVTRTAVVEDVAATREAGRLVVTWKPVGECDELAVAWGRSADGVDHRHVCTVPAAAGRAAVDVDGESGRFYVSVAPAGDGGEPGGAAVAAERRIGFNGAANFRDLGGYRGRGGETVCWGRVFRSDALLFDDTDLEVFAGLGVRTVYDLRSEVERRAEPDRLPAHAAPEVVALPLVSGDASNDALERIEGSDGESFLSQLYLHVMERSAPTFGLLLSGLADEERLPAVFHCAAGKDRTGMVAAVLLSVLGVSREDVLDDYELTTRYRTADHVNASAERLRQRRDLPAEAIAGILRAPRWAMQAALEATARRFGDFDGYLTGPAGAHPSVPDRLRSLLLRP